MPIIFASSLLLFPSVLFQLAGQQLPNRPGWRTDRTVVPPRRLLHLQRPLRRPDLLLLLFLDGHHLQPQGHVRQPEELRHASSPAIGPGRRTADYLEKVMVRITYVGAGFLAVVAIIPTVVDAGWASTTTVASFYGGTSLLIAVSVAFDLVQKIDSHLVMRNYRGLLERGSEVGRRMGRGVHSRLHPSSHLLMLSKTYHANRLHRPAGRRQRNPGRAAGPDLPPGPPLHRRHAPRRPRRQDRAGPARPRSTCPPGNWCPTT